MNSQSNLTEAAKPAAGGHPERFDPEEHGGGRLMEAEHRGRYWWAAQIAADKDILDAACGTGYGMAILAQAGCRSVTGIDLDAQAVAEASMVCGSRGKAIEGDVRELPFADESFDLVVCWETIEHVAEGERVVAEFRRVLRPDGVLLISSPNPDVYPAGNEHHVHEYRPQELVALVRTHFDQIASFAQSPKLAAAIEPSPAGDDGAGTNGRSNGSNGKEAAGGHQVETRATVPTEPGQETYGIVAASASPLPRLEPLIALGGDFEVRWWTERVEAVSSEARVAIEAVEIEARRHLAESADREMALRERLNETAAALHGANQELAQVPVLHHRVAQAQEEATTLRLTYENSRSWRLTAPLRRLKQRLRGRL
jgi:SAM-dependent methyltransferase